MKNHPKGFHKIAGAESTKSIINLICEFQASRTVIHVKRGRNNILWTSFENKGPAYILQGEYLFLIAFKYLIRLQLDILHEIPYYKLLFTTSIKEGFFEKYLCILWF